MISTHKKSRCRRRIQDQEGGLAAMVPGIRRRDEEKEAVLLASVFVLNVAFRSPIRGGFHAAK